MVRTSAIYALSWVQILGQFSLFMMQNYLTQVWKISFTNAAAILNVWGGISMILPVFILFLADAFVGKFIFLVISSIAYTLGMGLVTMSTPPVLGNPCKQYEAQCIGDTQRALLYTGMALVAVGIASNSVCLLPLIKELGKRARTDSRRFLFITAYLIPVVLLPIVGGVALPLIKAWSLAFGIPAICTALATLLFLISWCKYPQVELQGTGSPLTCVCRVFVAAALKISESFPLDPNNQLYKENEQDSSTRTLSLRFLEKAAIVLPEVREEHHVKKWRLCTVSEVEDAKIAVRMFPIWITFIVCGIVSSIGNTYFVEQASHMYRKIGLWTYPIEALLMISVSVKTIVIALAREPLKKVQRYGPSTGIAVSMVFSVLCCITAAKIEIKRLKVIRVHDLVDQPDEDIPMSIWWAVPQFLLLSCFDAFFQHSASEFYMNESPDSMTEYLIFFVQGASGIGFMCSAVSVYVVGKVSELSGGTNWFRFTLNRSRLDRYYWVLAALSSVNLIAFIMVASRYRYKKRKPVLDDNQGSNETKQASGA